MKKQIKKGIDFFKESKSELQKVTWPSRGEVLRYTTIVILTILISMAVIFTFDLLLIKIVQVFVIR
jgi:preprotein translocase subunit SecE